MSDIDAMEWCARCKSPLALVETARFNGHWQKAGHLRPMAQAAASLGVPAWLLFFEPRGEEIVGFHAAQLNASGQPEEFGRLSTGDWADRLGSLRRDHTCESGQS